MKFQNLLVDLNRGILGVPDPLDLWEQIITNLPDEIFKKPNLKVLLPSCGQCSEGYVLVKKLQNLGFDNNYIKSCFYLIDNDGFATINAVKNYGFLEEQVINTDFIHWRPKNNMKFDIILANPPYRAGNEKGGKNSLWRKFVKKSFELVNENGYVAIVCPGFPYEARDLSECFTKNTPLLLVNDATQYFPNIGSDIKYWIVKEGKHNLPFYVDGQVWEKGLSEKPTYHPLVNSIRKKIDSFPKFECKSDVGYSSAQFKHDPKEYLEQPTAECIYPIRHASKVKVCYVSKPTECHYKNKIMMTFSGYPDFKYYDGKNEPMSSSNAMSGYIEVKDYQEGQALIQLYTTKFYRFLSSLTRAGMKGKENYSLPKLDLSKTWSDVEIYQHFNLTDTEINYVENSINSSNENES